MVFRRLVLPHRVVIGPSHSQTLGRLLSRFGLVRLIAANGKLPRNGHKSRNPITGVHMVSYHVPSAPANRCMWLRSLLPTSWGSVGLTRGDGVTI